MIECLLEMGVEVINSRLAVDAKIDSAAVLQDEGTVKKGEGVRRRAVNCGTDRDALCHEAAHHCHHLFHQRRAGCHKQWSACLDTDVT